MTEGGRLAYINRSPGGVPKLHVPTALITLCGVEGDQQADTRHHGGRDRPWCFRQGC